MHSFKANINLFYESYDINIHNSFDCLKYLICWVVLSFNFDICLGYGLGYFAAHGICPSSAPGPILSWTLVLFLVRNSVHMYVGLSEPW